MPKGDSVKPISPWRASSNVRSPTSPTSAPLQKMPHWYQLPSTPGEDDAMSETSASASSSEYEDQDWKRTTEGSLR